MSWRSHGRDNDDLVDTLRGNEIVKSESISKAMKAVDRGHYVSARDKRNAYVDSPQSISHAATISAPHMHAYCLELLAGHLRPGARCLDVGSGSGYLTSVFAHLVAGADEAGGEAPGPGKAIGIEHIPELQVSRDALCCSPLFTSPFSPSFSSERRYLSRSEPREAIK